MILLTTDQVNYRIFQFHQSIMTKLQVLVLDITYSM